MKFNYYGFNFQWMVAWKPGSQPQPADEKALDFLAAYGFNFVRVPTDYRFWTRDFDYFHPDEAVFQYIDQYIAACNARGIHVCLNIHRAPGFCTNRNDLEKHNLWRDAVAQNAFVFLWETFARRYKDIPNEALSFNLLNEPPAPWAHGMTRRNHAALIRRTVASIRAVDSERTVIIDGLGGGFYSVPELADLSLIHSGRGYHPMPVTHHQASWWADHVRAPEPKYPGLRWQGQTWDRSVLRNAYKPWREVERRGTTVHIGEFGCFNRTPQDMALRWLSDMLGIYREFGWGYALWQFHGPFGIVEHGRPGARYELLHGFRVDRSMLDLLLENRSES